MATDFGTLLRDLREKAKVSLGTLARHLKVSTPYLSDVERGYRKPLTRERILLAAQLLNVSPIKLLQAAAGSRGFFELPMPLGNDPARQQVGAALMRGWPDLSDQDLERINKILEAAEAAEEEGGN